VLACSIWVILYVFAYFVITYALLKDKRFITWLAGTILAIVSCAGSCVSILM